MQNTYVDKHCLSVCLSYAKSDILGVGLPPFMAAKEVGEAVTTWAEPRQEKGCDFTGAIVARVSQS